MSEEYVSVSTVDNRTATPYSVIGDAAPGTATSSRLAQRWMITLYTFAIFVGAALVFLVQPIVAKMALPLYGGTPAVWNTSLVFFQAVLLLGYTYAHASTRFLGLRRQSKAHLLILLLPLAVLPLGLPGNAAPSDSVPPALWLLYTLTLTAGIPYFVVSTASPLLQRWFSGIGHTSAHDPYFLYAASNAGSLLSLVAYPFVIEPNLSLSEQANLWTAIYILFTVICTGAAVLLWRFPNTAFVLNHTAEHRSHSTPQPAWQERLRWVFLAFIPSSLMVGVTNYLSTDVAAVPLLWIIPLSTYLLTFILAFANRKVLTVRRTAQILPFVTIAAVLLDPRIFPVPIISVIAAHVILLFIVGMLAHGQLSDRRPAAEHLTQFYMLMSLGGVLGGVFNALIAPVAFNNVAEYPLVLFLALLLRPGKHRNSDESRYGWVLDYVLPLVVVFTVVLVGILGLGPFSLILGMLVSLAFLRRPVRFAVSIGMVLAMIYVASQPALLTERTFFGVLQVRETDEGWHLLSHGTTVHGIQDMTSAESRKAPMSYYSRSGPIGQVFTELQTQSTFDDVAVVGLGVGSLAAYGQAGQAFTFYEIDPAVVDIATDARYFTFLEDSPADISIVVGDGRLKLEDAPDDSYNLISLDAFSSDSVPVHLITREAVELYLSKLRDGGVLVFNVSNRNVDLKPVIAAIANDQHLIAISRLDDQLTEAQKDAGVLASEFVVVARSDEDVKPLLADPRWSHVKPSNDVWTDDFSNILTVIKWSR